MRHILTIIVLSLACTTMVSAAPLFPDVPDNHWAKDAVAALAAKGLVEGYPDGTFKGDRSASRWEVAMVVARLLAKMEQAHATFATKAELDELRKLTEALREELGALGVRVDNLEEDVELIDERVTELERLTFYGELKVRVGGQGFTNDGSPGIGPNQEFVNYHQVVGTAAGASGPLGPGSLTPAGWANTTHGVIPVIDGATGRPLTTGTTFTALATLGMEAKISPEFKAGLELKAYSSQGDTLVDAFQGLQAPYLSNQFTAISSTGIGVAGAGISPLDNTPFTRVNLDNFWIRHEPSGTTARFGWFPTTDFDNSVYVPQRSPGDTHFATPYFFGGEEGSLGSYGIQVKGEIPSSDPGAWLLRWEGMYTILADGNISAITGASYKSHAEGGNLAFVFDEERAEIKFNFLHAANEASGGVAAATGQIVSPITALQWVNPNGFYANQLSAIRTAGAGSFTDVRPVPGVNLGLLSADGNSGIPGAPAFGAVGPQDQITYGVSADYTFDHEWNPHIFAEYSHSDYRPSKNSPYTVDGDAYRFGFDLELLEGDLNLHGEYVSTDPTYSPFLLQYPQLGGIAAVRLRTPYFNELPFLYSLHDTATFTNNREGFRTNAQWWFSENGQIKVSYGRLSQVRPSVQDIRFSNSALGALTPNSEVLGFSPGFKEFLYFPVSRHTFAPSGNNALGRVLESEKGVTTEFSITGAHEWIIDEEEDRGITFSGMYLNHRFRRDSNLAAIRGDGRGVQGENENFMDFRSTGWLARVDYDVTRKLSMHAAFTQINTKGHWDPSGVYSPYAEATGSTRFVNIDNSQSIPELGFNWEVAENVKLDTVGRLFETRDKVPDYVFASPIVQAQNQRFTPTTGTHPFDWSGWQVTSTLSVNF